ncbi:MAG: hypothetical protein ACYS5V_07270, partial [Planctomycetota bacterium]|jgi:hypothetical protein
VQGNDLWREEHVEGLWVPDQAFGGGAFSIYAHDGYDTDGDGIADGDGDLVDDWMDPLTLTAVGTYQGARHTVQAVVPPVKWALMVCDPDNLSAEDTVRLALMRGAGWRVRLLRAQATGAEFDEAVDNMHVVYFPAHTPLETDVKNRLKGLSLPIVTGHAHLVKELKIAGADSRAYEDEFIDVLELQRRVTDDAGQEVLEVYTHHITAPFAVGPVRICSKPLKLLRLDGPAVGTLALASQTGQPDMVALAVLECGALRTDERPARARRVALPWGSSDSDFSIESLTTEGQQVLLRSLDWAAGSWRGYLPGIAVWEKIEVLGMAGIDGFASAIGPYGGGNVNGDCTLSSNSVDAGDINLAGGVVNGHVFVSPDANMGTVIDLDPGCALLGTTRYLSLNVPVLVPQPLQGMPASVGDRTYATGFYVVDTDRHYRKLTIRGDAVVFVIGDDDRRVLQTHVLCPQERVRRRRRPGEHHVGKPDPTESAAGEGQARSHGLQPDVRRRVHVRRRDGGQGGRQFLRDVRRQEGQGR